MAGTSHKGLVRAIGIVCNVGYEQRQKSRSVFLKVRSDKGGIEETNYQFYFSDRAALASPDSPPKCMVLSADGQKSSIISLGIVHFV